jgi:hypothetical protein
MKKTLISLAAVLLLALPLRAQQKNETSEYNWNAVDSLVNKQYYDQAYKLSQQLFQQAQQSHNSHQCLVAAYHIAMIGATYRENNTDSIIATYRQLLPHLQSSDLQVAQLLLANQYSSYYYHNRYRISQNLPSDEENLDHCFWSANRFRDTVATLIYQALGNSHLLLSTPSTDYEPLITCQTGKDDNRTPTLFEVMLDVALNIYKQLNYAKLTTSDFANPALLYATPDRFTTMTTVAPPDSTRQMAAFLLACLQDKERLLLQSSVPVALIADQFTSRIEYHIPDLTAFLIENYPMQSYRDAINFFEPSHNPCVAQFYSKLAERYRSKGQYAEAMACIDSALLRYPNSPGAASCFNMRLIMTKKAISVHVNDCFPSSTNQLGVLQSRNVDSVQFRIIPYVEHYNRRTLANQLDFFLKQPIVEQWGQSIAKPDSYSEINTYFVIPPIPEGKYLLITIPIGNTCKSYSINTLEVNDYVLIPADKNEKPQSGFIIDRKSGHPVPNCTVTLYCHKDRQMLKHKVTSVKTDRNGYYDFSSFVEDAENLEHLDYLSISVKHKGRTIIKKRSWYKWESELYSAGMFVYFDRPIYKPGDTVGFSAIHNRIVRLGMQQQCIANDTIRVDLFDVNYKVIDSLLLVTDQFGAISGRFALDANLLPGKYILSASCQCSSGNENSFTVEAYKQPKFTVSLSAPSQERHLGQPVRIEGLAASYSAVPVSNAKVEYSVTRTEIHPFWRWWWDWTPSESVTVANGSTTTDANGNFTIEFIPEPDPNINPTLKPAFRFSVNATVTDLNGETHQTSTTVSVGYENAYLSISTFYEATDSCYSTVRLCNLEGSAIAGDVNVDICQLSAPINPKWNPSFKKNRAEHTNILLPSNISLEQMDKLFPYDDFDGSATDVSKWPIRQTVSKQSVSVNEKQPFRFNFNGLPAGAYKITAYSITPQGDTLRNDKFFFYTPSSATVFVEPKLITAQALNPRVRVNDTAVIRIGSLVDDVTLLVMISGQNTHTHRVLKLKRGFTHLTIPVADTLTSGFSVSLAAIKENSLQSTSVHFDIFRPERQLQLQWGTFRDKLQPGDNERWTLSIRQDEGRTPADANLMMTMYDHALDSYGYLYWSSNFWYNYYSEFTFPSTISDIVRSSNHSITTTEYKTVDSYNFSNCHFKSVDMYSYPYRYRKRAGIIDIGAPESGARIVSDDIERLSSNEIVAMVAGVGYDEEMVETEEVFSLQNAPATPALSKGGDVDFAFDFDYDTNEEVKIRQNMNTSAFFKPTLRSGDNGLVEITFAVPDLLTEWSIQGLAWTPDMRTGSISDKAVTQKRLMVVPNVPRFLRQGDTCRFSVKVSNMSGQKQSVSVSLEMSNGADGTPVDMIVGNKVQPIVLDDAASGEVSFLLAVPQDNVFVTNYKVIARAQGCSDGEQAPIPILPNRQLVTESMAFYINGAGEKHYEMKHLTALNAPNAQSTLQHAQLLLDLTPNPVWLALQTLPYVEQQKNPSSIYLANAIYTNSLAAAVVDNNPQVEQMFNEWSANEPDAFLSALDRNSDIKQTVMNETPWLRDAVNEQQRHYEMAHYFDRHKIDKQLKSDLSLLLNAQRSDGGWSWIEGGRESSLYTTQHILKTFGLLRQMGIAIDSKTRFALNKAMDYVDRENNKYYQKYIKGKGYDVINLDYLYLRSLYPDNKLTKSQQEAFDFFYNNAKKHNKEYTSLFCQSLLSLVFNRNGDRQLAADMATRIREKALYSDEMGMYWRDNTGSWLWSQRPIETQSMLIRTIAEVLGDYESVARMQQWLLKQKQTTNWNSDIATINAIQALLIGVGDSVQSPVRMQPSLISVTFGDHQLQTDTSSFQLHVSQCVDGDHITPSDGNVSIRKNDNGIAWGALYWQYFEQMDKIPSSSMGITLKQTLYRVNSEGSLTAVKSNDRLHVGDKVRIRLEINADRNLEYLELKMPRCAAFEPVSTRSGWVWNRGLSYYAAITNTASTLYIDRINKGSYVVEMDLFVNNAGTFTTAPTQMQCLYAPEFRALCPVPQVHVQP